MKAITKESVKRLNDYRDNPRIYIIGAMLANACAIYHDQVFLVALLGQRVEHGKITNSLTIALC